MRRILIVLILLLLTPSSPQAAERPELRAFWIDAFNAGFKTEAQVKQLIADASTANMNALIVQVRRRGDVYYLSSIEPRAADATLAPLPYDPLRTILTEAQARGMEVHVWLAALPVLTTRQGGVPPGHVLQRHGYGASGTDDWVMRDVTGATADSEGNIWLDPGHPAVIDYTEAVVRELLTRYPEVDGLHLDRIRYPGVTYGYNPTAVARFNAHFGRSGTPDPVDPQWMDWRREQVTALVRRVALATAELAPQARVSVAAIAWGDGPEQVGGWENSTPYKQVLQDWHGWLRTRLIDTAVVMNYDREHVESQRAFFDHWLAWQTTKGGGSVVAGPAAYLNSIDGTLAQITRAQRAGATGVALYSYGTTNKDGRTRAELLRALAAGPFARPTGVPSMPWKAQRGALSGTLEGLPGPARSEGVSVALFGPDSQILISDGSGRFGAPSLAAGEYTAVVALGGNRSAFASARVMVGGAARLSDWQVAELTPRFYLPLTVSGG